MSDTTLADKIEQNQIAAETAQNQKNKQTQQQQAQQQAEYAESLKEQEELQKQIAEYDLQVKQLEAEQKAEEEKALAIKQAEQKRIADQKAINDKYDAQITSLGAKPSKYYYKPKYYTNRYTGHTRLIGHTRESNHNAIKNYNSKVDTINRSRSTELTNFEISYSEIPATFIASARREAGRNSGVNILARAQQKWDSFLAQSEYQRQSSITTAKSNVVKAREQHQITIREFESKRDSVGIKLNEAQAKLKALESQKATKSRPKVVTSSHFKEKQDTPSSIYGTTISQSQKAKTTYGQTQEQQKSLFDKVTGAASWNEAIRHRQQTMNQNPYLGTANTISYKGGAIGSSGSLLNLQLERVSLDGTTEEPLFQRRKKEKELLNSLDEKERLNYRRNKNGDLVLRDGGSLAVNEPQLESLHTVQQTQQRFTVTTPDGKTRTFKDEKTADKFIQRTRGSYKTIHNTNDNTMGLPKPEISRWESNFI